MKETDLAIDELDVSCARVVRLWRTGVDFTRWSSYEEFVRTRSTSMFRQQQGCAGVLFLRSGESAAALSFWEDWRAAEQLQASPSYQLTTADLSSSGLLEGRQELEVFECQSGWLRPSGLGVRRRP